MRETTQETGNGSEAGREALKTLVIKGSEWLRGEGGSKSALLRSEDGKKCCLGILALVCGFTEEEIRGVETPSGVVTRTPWPFGAGREVSEVNKAMNINDTTPSDSGLPPCGDVGHIDSDDKRIEKLRPLFEEWGYEIDWRPSE